MKAGKHEVFHIRALRKARITKIFSFFNTSNQNDDLYDFLENLKFINNI